MLKKGFLLAVLVILIAAMVSTSYARGDGSLTLLGRALSGAAKSVFVQGDYAYVGASHFLLVFNILDPGNPVVTGKVPVEGDWVWVSGSYAYVVGHIGLDIVDVSDPAQPTVVGSYQVKDGLSVTTSGDYAYLSGYDGLYVLDISDPSRPGEVAFRDMDTGPRGLLVSDGLLYVSEIIGGLRVFDVSDPANPLEVGRYVTTSDEWAGGIQKEGDYLYMGVTHVGNGHSNSFVIIDVSDPTQPVKAGEIIREEEDGRAFSASVSRNYAYLSYAWGGLDIVDVSDPAAPQKVGSYKGHIMDVSVGGDYAYIAADNGGFQVIDVSDPADPTLGYTYGYTYSTGDEVHAVCSVGNTIYTASGTNGLEVFNASDPVNPALIGTGEMPGRATDVAVSGHYAYVMGGSVWPDATPRKGLFVFDIFDPAHPEEVGFLSEEGGTLVLYDRYVFISNRGKEKVVIVDVSDPTHPVVTSTIPSGIMTRDVVVSDGFCYIATIYGLRIADVSDPANPEILSDYKAEEYKCGGLLYPGAVNVAVAGDYACFVDVNSDPTAPYGNCAILRIVDVSDRTEPKQVGSFRLSNVIMPFGLVLWNDYAFVRILGAGIRVIDVIDPAHPVEAGWYVHQFGWGNLKDTNLQSLHIADGKVYVANHEAGLYILQMSNRLLTLRIGHTAVEEDTRIASMPSAFAMSQNFPNPFNPCTEIRYALPEAGLMRLSVFNLLGQEIRVLAEGFREPGTYSVRWDGRDQHGLEAAAGVYLVRLEAGEFSQTRRMALVK